MSGPLQIPRRRIAVILFLGLVGCGESAPSTIDASTTADLPSTGDDRPATDTPGDALVVDDVPLRPDAPAPDDAGAPPADAALDGGPPPDRPTLADAPPADVCAPRCATRACGDDGCGGSCGTCEGGLACLASGLCEARVDVVEVAAGRGHTCARRSTGAVLCWGRNVDGELADGTTLDNQLRPRPVVGLSDAVELALGDDFTCARRASGGVVCWGNNNQGQVGDGSDGNVRRAPVAVADLTDAVEIDAGAAHACARRAGGTVVCWGLNSLGELGNGSTAVRRNRPVEVSGLSDAAEVSVGSFHTCARRAGGAVVCWGRNNEGQLGNGANEIGVRTPVAVTGLVDAVHIAAEGHFTCAIRAGALVTCWGVNSSGQLGAGSVSNNRNVPGLVPELSGVTQLALGFGHACARLGGEVRCWGANDRGLVGDGTTESPRLRPTSVSGISDAEGIAANGNTSCARRRSGAVLCWGNNSAGQLGDGMIGNVLATPTAVAGL